MSKEVSPGRRAAHAPEATSGLVGFPVTLSPAAKALEARRELSITLAYVGVCSLAAIPASLTTSIS